MPMRCNAIKGLSNETFQACQQVRLCAHTKPQKVCDATSRQLHGSMSGAVFSSHSCCKLCVHQLHHEHACMLTRLKQKLCFRATA